MSSGLREVFYDVQLFPCDFLAKHGVEHGDQFSHAGDQRNHFQFALGEQALVEVFDDWIMNRRGDGSLAADEPVRG